MITSDDGYDWRKAEQFELTPRRVVFDDGTAWEPERMERPFVLTDEVGKPRVLYVACKKSDHSCNMVLPLSLR